MDTNVASLSLAPFSLRDTPALIERVFPAVPDHFLIGPMFQLGWGKPAGMFTRKPSAR